MAYNVTIVNLFEQFGVTHFDVLVQDDENILPSYRVSKDIKTLKSTIESDLDTQKKDVLNQILSLPSEINSKINDLNDKIEGLQAELIELQAIETVEEAKELEITTALEDVRDEIVVVKVEEIKK
jgi:hypothetical protein